MKMCNSTNNLSDSCEVKILQGLAYCPVFFLGFVLNATALKVFVAKWGSWTDTHVYMFNLAIANFTLIFFLPFRIFDSFFCLPMSQLCTVLIHVHYINMYGSILTTGAISVHRYLAIIFPLQVSSWRRKKETASVVCLVMWTLLLTISTVFNKENQPNKLRTCYERCKNKPLKHEFLLMMQLLGFAIPLLIIIFCSTWIIYTLSMAKDKSEEKRSTMGIVMANMVVFIICYTPFHIVFLVNNLFPPSTDCRSDLPTHVYLRVSEWIASTNCCFDSIGYYFLLRHFHFWSREFDPIITLIRKRHLELMITKLMNLKKSFWRH